MEQYRDVFLWQREVCSINRVPKKSTLSGSILMDSRFQFRTSLAETINVHKRISLFFIGNKLERRFFKFVYVYSCVHAHVWGRLACLTKRREQAQHDAPFVVYV